jgi:hypothetical protein
MERQRAGGDLRFARWRLEEKDFDQLFAEKPHSRPKRNARRSRRFAATLHVGRSQTETDIELDFARAWTH